MSRFDSNQPLTVALRPARLVELRGQPDVVRRLQKFVRRPYPCGFIFTSATGVGKSTAARALAGELGCIIEGSACAQQCGGFWDLNGANVTVQEARDRIRSCHYGTLAGSGWRVFSIAEADRMTSAAFDEFNFVLDNPLSRSVWIFTTNLIHEFDRRFVNRCEVLRFESDARVLKADANQYIKILWKEAAQEGRAPTIEDIPQAVVGNHLSYRAIINGLAALID